MQDPLTLSHAAAEAYDLLPLPILIVSLDTLRVLKSNPAARTWLGAALDMPTAPSLADVLPQGDAARLAERVSRSANDPGTWTVVAGSGARFAVALAAGKVDFDGTAAVVLTAREVTPIAGPSGADGTPTDPSPERTAPVFDGLPGAALLGLEERETRLEKAERLLGTGRWEFDFARGVLNWSEKVFDIHGVPRDRQPPDFGGYIELVHPNDRDQVVADCAAFVETGASEIEFRHRILRADGTVSHIHGAGARHSVDGREILVGFVQDISAVVEKEEELRKQTQQRKMASRLAKLGSWRIDADGTHVIWDERTAAIHDEPEGTSPTLDQAISYIAPEWRALFRARSEACLRAGTAYDELLQIVTARGRQVWVRAVGEPVRDDADRIVAVEGAFQDVTDLIAARGEAAELSQRLLQTLESMSDAFYLLDSDWRFTFINTKAERLLQRSREELLGQNVWDMFPEAAAQVGQPFERALRENRMIRFEQTYPPLGIWFEVSANPTPAGLAVYFRDITEERARNAQFRLLETAVENLNDILLITEAEPFDAPEGPRIVYVNDAFERRTGFTREEVVGKTPRILQGPKTQRSELDRIRRALEAWEPVRAELINYTKSGEEFWLELDIVPLADASGWFTHWIAVERDITYRKKWDQELEASEQRFRLVSQSSGTAIWEWNIADGGRWWSAGLEEVFGHRQNPDRAFQNLGRAHVHPEDAARIDAALQALATGAADTLHETYRFCRADGSWAWVEDRAFVMRDADGTLARVLGSMTDISERQNLEKQLRQTQKLEAIGQLTGGIAHDFNNILAVIMGNSELLAEDLEDRPDLRGMAGQIIGAAQRGAELTRRLLAFARKQPLQPVVTDLNVATRSMAPLIKRGLGESVEIEMLLSDDLWLVEIDPGQLESALLNLAINARDAMPSGGKLLIETYNTLIGAETAAADQMEEGRFAVVAVSDTGCGISQDDIERVLEPFFSTKGHGSGLGLPMVFGFTRQSGGHLKIYSEVNEGTTVKLYFPQAAPDAIEARQEAPAARMPGGRGEVLLVVEDDPDVRRNVVSIIRSLGYKVLEAQDAAEALDLLDRHPEIALLFTDVVMPGGMDGRELAEAALRRRPDLRVVYTSGYTENAIVHHGRLDLGVDLISKPYRRQALAAKLRSVLDRSGKRE